MRRFWYLFFLPPCTLTPLCAQQDTEEQPIAQFTIHARTVIEDVVVQDKGGHAVSGLRKQDFQIFEDGKPQTVTFFEPNFTSTDTATSPPALPENTFTNVPLADPHNVTNVLLLDALNTWPEDEMYAHVQMVNYLASLPPHLRIGVFTLDPEKLNLIWPLNQDSSTLRAAVARFNSKSSKSSTTGQKQAMISVLDEVHQAASQSGDERLAKSASALQHFLKHGVGIIDSHNQLLITMNALHSLAQYLAGIPGRKNLYWVVGNFPYCDPHPPINCPYLDVTRRTMNLLAEAQVSVYPIYAGGIKADMGVGSYAFQHHISTELLTSNIWAEETGGKAYHINDVSREIADGVDHGSRYYTMAYVPTDTTEDGRERKVEIKILSGNYTIAYRRHYSEQTSAEIASSSSKPASTPLIPLMGHGLPNASELPYRLKVVPAALQPASATMHAGQNAAIPGKLTRYNVDIEIQPGSISLAPDADGARRRDLQVALVIYNQQFKPLNWDIRTVHLQITREQWAQQQNSGIPIHLQIDAPAGEVSLRTGIYDPASSKAGTLEIPLSILSVGQK